MGWLDEPIIDTPTSSPARTSTSSWLDEPIGESWLDEPIYSDALKGALAATGQTVQRGLEAYNPRAIQQARQQTSAFGPDDRQEILKRVNAEAQKLQAIPRAAYQTVALQQGQGMQQEAQELRQAAQAAQQTTDSPAKTAAKLGVAGGKALFHALDTPARVMVRGGKTPEEWNEGLRNSTGWGARAFVGATDLLTAIPGAALGAAVGGFGALSDLAAGQTPTWANFKQTVGETMRDSADVGRTIVGDPLSWFSLGGAGAGKVAGGAALRTALKAGLPAAAAEGLEKAAVSILARGGTLTIAERMRAVEGAFANAYRAAGRPVQEGVAAAQELFGARGQFLGRGQLTFGPNFLPGKLGQMGITSGQISSKLGGPEFPIGKAASALYDIARVPAFVARAERGAPPLRSLFDQTKDTVRAARQGFLGQAATKAEELNAYIKRFTENAPADKARREWIVQEVIDPSVSKNLGQWAADLASLSPTERAWVGEMRDFFNARHADLVKAGVLDASQIGRNKLTGDYFPRVFSAVTGHLDELAEVARAKNPSSLASRTADVALGDLGKPGLGHIQPVRIDPHEVLPAYVAQSTRAEAAKSFERFVADRFGRPAVGREATSGLLAGHWQKMTTSAGQTVIVPSDLANIVTGTFDHSWRTLGSGLRQFGLANGPVGRKFVAVADAMSWLNANFKRNVLTKIPGFHAVNATDDLIKFFADGGEIRDLANAKMALAKKGGITTPAGQRLTGEQLLEEMHANNIGHGTYERQDVGHFGQDMAARLESIARQNRGLGTTPRAVAKDAWTRYQHLGSDLGSWWEDFAKASVYVRRRRLGDSPQLAAQRAFDVMLDYGDRSKRLQVASWFLPFATWTAKAPISTAKQILRRPGGVLAAHRLAEGMAGPEKYEQRQDIRERGAYYAGTARGEEVTGNIRKAIGRAVGLDASGWRPGYGVALPLRNAFTESVAPWIQAVPKMMGGEGNTDPLAMQLHPFIRAIVESWSQKDLFTKQDLKRPELGKPFAKGTPLVPAGWQAEANQNPWLARTLVPFLTNPITVHALNRAAYSLGGGQARSAPVAAFGSYRPYTQSGRADDLFAMQVLGLLTRQTPYETDPSALLQLLAAQPAAAAAPEAAADAKKRVSKAREAARVEGRSSTR